MYAIKNMINIRVSDVVNIFYPNELMGDVIYATAIIIVTGVCNYEQYTICFPFFWGLAVLQSLIFCQ